MMRFIGALLAAAVLLGGAALGQADDAPKKPDDKKQPDKKAGTVTGTVTAKDKNWIEVKADGEEKGRRYVPRWVGGNPDKGGGPDKKMLQTIGEVKVGSRVKLEWEFEERARAVKIEVLKAPTDK